MNLQIRFLIAVLLGLFLFTDTALAGWIVSYKDSETGEQRQDYYEKDMANLGGSIFTDDHIIVADQGSRSYWEGTPRQYCDSLKSMKKKMQEQLASLPAQYRPVPISQKKVTRKKIGTQSIAGYSATGYEFFVDGIQNGQVWVSSDSALSGLIALQESKVDNFKCFDEMKGMSLEDSALYKKMEKNAFMLKESWQEVVAVEQKNLPSGTFDAPDGYKSFSDYQQFTDYMSSNQSRSSSRSMPHDNYQEEVQEEPEMAADREEEPASRRKDNVVVKDTKDIAKDSAREVRQSTKRGIQKEISKDIQKGVGRFLKKIF